MHCHGALQNLPLLVSRDHVEKTRSICVKQIRSNGKIIFRMAYVWIQTNFVCSLFAVKWLHDSACICKWNKTKHINTPSQIDYPTWHCVCVCVYSPQLIPFLYLLTAVHIIRPASSSYPSIFFPISTIDVCNTARTENRFRSMNIIFSEKKNRFIEKYEFRRDGQIENNWSQNYRHRLIVRVWTKHWLNTVNASRIISRDSVIYSVVK